MDPFWESTLAILKELSPIIVALAALAGIFWRFPSKSDMAKMESRLDGRLDKLEAKIDHTRDTLEAKIADTRSELKADIIAVETKVDKLDAKIDHTRDTLDAKIDHTRDTLEARIADTRSELKADIKVVEAKVDKTNEHYLELRGDVKALNRDVAALTDKTSRIERDLEVTRSASP